MSRHARTEFGFTGAAKYVSVKGKEEEKTTPSGTNTTNRPDAQSCVECCCACFQCFLRLFN